ncbi:MAG TPA: hypothetical protein VFC19_03830 [Candidatus Limnocylindrales bacterium]|nr:hypothetical protein [Candidatus Limnocylindrales bacterium]
MAKRPPGGTAGRRTAHIPRPRRADHDTIHDDSDDSVQENPDTTTSVPATGALVRYLTDPAIEEAIQAFVDTAPPMSEVKRAKIARLLGTDRCRYHPGD